MRHSWGRFLTLAVVGALAMSLVSCAVNPPTPTLTATTAATARPATRTPRVPTVTPELVVTEVLEGIHLTDITVMQPDIPSGEMVVLPTVADDAYTYDGNIITFNVSIGSDSDITFPLRIEVTDSTNNAVLASADVAASNTNQNSATVMWDTLDTSWTADGTVGGVRTIVVSLLDEANETLDSANFALTVRPRPVVLIQGWSSTDGMWSNYVTYLADAADGWVGLPADNLSTGAPGQPFHDAKWNADKLNEFITAQREELDAQHLDLVGHSMGGLIGRAYLQAYGAQDADGQPVVLRLLTLGTPNQGSPCGNVGAVLSVFSSKLDGAWHFTPAYMNDFNRTVTDTHGTTIHALAGTNVWTCGITGDGVVPVGSATAYGTDNRVASFTAHIPGVELWELVFGARDFEYSQTQFNDFTLPKLRAPWSETAPLALIAQAASSESDAPPVTQRFTLTIPAASIAVMTVSAFDGEDLGVMIAPVAGVTAELRAPDGTVIASLDEEDMETLPVGVLPYEDAPAGRYTVHFTNNSPITVTMEMAVFESGLSYVLDIEVVQQADGTTLVSAALFQNGAPVTNAVLTAHLELTEGDVGTSLHPLTDEEAGSSTANDGVYSTVLDLPAGVYALAVKAQTSDYSVTESHTFTVNPPSGD